MAKHVIMATAFVINSISNIVEVSPYCKQYFNYMVAKTFSAGILGYPEKSLTYHRLQTNLITYMLYLTQLDTSKYRTTHGCADRP